MLYCRSMANLNKEKAKQYRATYYRKNKLKVLAHNLVRKRRNIELVRSLKNNTPCFDCGVQYPYYVMDFDHREPKEKKAIISKLVQGWSIQSLQSEINKCDIVCANCHRKRTFDQSVENRKRLDELDINAKH